MESSVDITSKFKYSINFAIPQWQSGRVSPAQVAKTAENTGDSNNLILSLTDGCFLE